MIDVAEVTREEMQKLLTVAPVSVGNGEGMGGEAGGGDDW